MLEEEFKEILDKKETDTVEFKSWVNARNMKEIISLAVDVRTWFRWGSLVQDIKAKNMIEWSRFKNLIKTRYEMQM